MITLKSFIIFQSTDQLMFPVIRTTCPPQAEFPHAACLQKRFPYSRLYKTHNPQLVPHPECNCGYHSIFPPQPFDAHQITCLEIVAHRTMMLPLGCLTLTAPHGLTIQHEHGVRSQFLTILALISPYITATALCSLSRPPPPHTPSTHNKIATIAHNLSVPLLTHPNQINHFVNSRLHENERWENECEENGYKENGYENFE